jgi:Ca2+/Na+ antiporter
MGEINVARRGSGGDLVRRGSGLDLNKPGQGQGQAKQGQRQRPASFAPPANAAEETHSAELTTDKDEPEDSGVLSFVKRISAATIFAPARSSDSELITMDRNNSFMPYDRNVFYKTAVPRKSSSPLITGEAGMELSTVSRSGTGTRDSFSALNRKDTDSSLRFVKPMNGSDSHIATLTEGDAETDVVRIPATRNMTKDDVVVATRIASDQIAAAPPEGAVPGEFSGWVYKRARAFSRHRMLSNEKWQLRFFQLDENGLRHSRDVREAGSKGTYKQIVNVFDLEEVFISQSNKFEFTVKAGGSSYRFRCLNALDLSTCVSAMEFQVAKTRGMTPQMRRQLQAEAEVRLVTIGEHVVADGSHHNIMTGPSEGKWYEKVMHRFLFPLKVMIFYTVPEIAPSEERDSTSKKYWSTIMSSIMWLAILSYLMNFALEEMGLLLGISAGAMGLTFGAAGTSVPNLLSSMLVARQGLGNMAISNAFGSNIFCIYFVLGFSWVIFILAQNNDPYDGLKDDGIVLMVIILLIVMIAFIAMVVVTRFVLYTWMSYVFLLVYAGFLAFAFAIN